MRLVLGGCKMSRSHLPIKIFRVYLESLQGSVMYATQMVSTPHYSFKVVSLKWFSQKEK